MRNSLADLFGDLLEQQTPPCISIYMPVARGKAMVSENPRRLRDLIDKAQRRLAKRYSKRQYGPIIAKLRDVEADTSSWQQPGEALALFASPTLFKIVPMARPRDELLAVADSFHLKPLIRAQQFPGRFQILCLTQKKVELYEGNHDRLDDVPLRNVPASLEEALGTELTEPQHTRSWRTGRGVNAPAVHGRHSKKDEVDIDLARFFRIVDRAILENHSRPSGLPLILCAAPHYHDRFRKVSHNPNLVPQGIKFNPESISIDRLHEEAWKIIAPYYRHQVEKIVEEWGKARAHAHGSEDIEKVAEAAAQSRVSVLLVDADMRVGGKIDPGGRVEFGDLADPAYDDILDDIAERVIKTGGKVLVMAHGEMPSETGVAAIYRY